MDIKTLGEEAGERLDKFLAAKLFSLGFPLSRARVQELVKTGLAAGAGVDPARKIKAGEEYSVSIPEARAMEVNPAEIPLDVVFEDNSLIVINKPPGLVTHPAPGNRENTLVNALLHHCRGGLSGINGVERPGIVHRLDKDTSGLIVVAKTDRAHRGLAAQIESREAGREYLAVVRGVLLPPAGRITGNIGRSRRNRKKMAVVKTGGKEAVTLYKVLENFGKASLVHCRLLTGRTHQIRVHMAHKGHPLLGDTVYGGGGAFHRQALHAFRLSFRHPETGKDMSFEAAMPEDMAALVAGFRAL